MNDWRLVENQPAVEGGDVVLVSANLKSIKEANNPTPTPQPATPAADEEPKKDKPEEDNDDTNENEE